MLSRGVFGTSKGRVLKEILQNGECRNYLIFDSIEKGDVETLQTLIRAGININQVDKNGYSPLQRAVQREDICMVYILLVAGADANQTTKDTISLIQWVVRWGNIEMLRLLIKAGADVNGINSHGRSPLWQAVRLGRLKVALVLLQGGANVNQEDSDGRSPLWCAVHRGHLDSARLLLAAGAKLDQLDHSQYLRLIQFLNLGLLKREIAFLFIEHGFGLSTILDSVGIAELIKLLQLNLDPNGAEILWISSRNGNQKWVTTINQLRELPRTDRLSLLSDKSISTLNLKGNLRELIASWRAIEYFYALELLISKENKRHNNINTSFLRIKKDFNNEANDVIVEVDMKKTGVEHNGTSLIVRLVKAITHFQLPWTPVSEDNLPF